MNNLKVNNLFKVMVNLPISQIWPRGGVTTVKGLLRTGLLRLFLAALSSSRSVVVGWSVCLSVCRSETFVKKQHVEYYRKKK